MKIITTFTAVLALTAIVSADPAKKEEPKKAPDAPKMEAPKPAQELTDMAKTMAGSWNCTGKFIMDPAKPAVEFKGTNKMALDLDKFWLKGEYSLKAGAMTMKGTEYITYDAAQKKWFRLAMDNMGGSETASSDGMTAGKGTWTGDSRMMGMTMKTKTNVEAGAKELKVSSDMSMDGKKWMTNAFEMTCKK